MAKRKPASGDVIDVIKELMALHGTKAFETNGHVQLYSGPEQFIKRALTIINNRGRAFKQAEYNNAKLIDQTPVGKHLDPYKNGKDIYAYFVDIYGARTPKSFYHADKVMRFTSHAFTKACYGHVETAVCGAGLNRIFFEVELPELVRNNRIETINDIPMQRIRDIYYTQGAYIASREICKAELLLLQNRTATKKGKDFTSDRKDRLKFFRKISKSLFEKIRARNKNTLDHLGPILPHVEIDKPIRFMVSQAPYVSRSMQYG